MIRFPVLIGAICLACLLAIRAAADDGSGFRFAVQSVLSKAGCNAGACHGNQNGKGGFRLSLRGQDAGDDHRSLTRDFGGRRIDPLNPDRSLVLMKATAQVPHQGGRRFEVGSLPYESLRQWIARGAPMPEDDEPRVERLEVQPSEFVLRLPNRSAPLRVTAQMSDGTVVDVTRRAVYETSSLQVTVSADGVVSARDVGEATIAVRFLNRQVPVRWALTEARPDFVWNDPPSRNYVDRWVHAKLQRLRMNPSPPADDSTFVRRAYLDVLGILPTADQSQQFVNDSRRDKRVLLIDQLLARPELAEHWALKWSDVLRNEEKVLDRRGVTVLHQWLQQSMAEAKPLDQFVRELVVARGSTYDHPPANYYRANRDPATRGETTARLFLGVRLQCAKCHNHPFDRWTQDDYYQWAAVFARIGYKIVDNKRPDKFDKNQFVGEQIVEVQTKGEVKHPQTGLVAKPKLLGAEPLALPQPQDDRLEPMARWLTAPKNRQFARRLANMIWFHVMGRGLVEPVDDFRVTNPASHPELLDALADDLVAHDYDLRHLIRVIMTSQTYQLSAEPNADNLADEHNYARAMVRRLPAEQLLDAQCRALGATAEFVGYPRGTRAGQIAGVHRLRPRDNPPAEGDRFLFTFGKPQRLLACECERSSETTLSQALVLVSGQGLHDRLTSGENDLRRWTAAGADPDEVVERLYWAALSRPPSEPERAYYDAALQGVDDPTQVLEDIAWAVLNSKEFIFRH